MKKSILVLLAVMPLFSTGSAKAALLPGQVTGYSMLGCMVTNFTGTTQILDQVQYQYTCNHGPRDPFHTYFQVYPCFGMCEIQNGRNFWHTNGPWTQNCMVVSSHCQGWSHTAPTPYPTMTPIPTPASIE